MFGNFFKKRRVRKVFRKVISAEAVDALMAGRSLPGPKIKPGRIEIVLLFIRAETIEQYSDRIALGSKLGLKHGWVVMNVLSSLTVLTYCNEMFPASKVAHSPREILVNDLLAQLAGDIKIFHGISVGHFGLFGSPQHMSYTFVVPKFDTALARLGQMDFGKVEEFAF